MPPDTGRAMAPSLPVRGQFREQLVVREAPIVPEMHTLEGTVERGRAALPILELQPRSFPAFEAHSSLLLELPARGSATANDLLMRRLADERPFKSEPRRRAQRELR